MSRPLLLLCCTVATLASAADEPDSAATSAQKVVETRIVKPLQAKELRLSRFSRARPMPTARRVRVLEEAPVKDAKGAAFMTFAIDTRRGLAALADETEAGWHRGDLSGCVYSTGDIFVKLGDETFPAEVLLGKKVTAVGKDVCRAAQGGAT